MKFEECISVIVPVYNKEKYLSQCIESIVKQSYDNLEILLVDDGSKDDSGRICDEYAKKDDRISVFHKENGGVSSARNFGITKAKGELMAFVDADDIISPYMYEILYKVMRENGTDLVCCDITSNFDELIHTPMESVPVEIKQNAEAVSVILDEKGYKAYIHNRLYRKELFEDVRFQDGKIYEDVIPAYKTMQKAEKVAYVRLPLEYYRKGKGYSSGTFSQDLLLGAYTVMRDAMKHFEYDRRRIYIGYLQYYRGYVCRGIRAGKSDGGHKKHLQNLVKKHLAKILKADYVSRSMKMAFVLYAVSPWGCAKTEALYHMIEARMQHEAD